MTTVYQLKQDTEFIQNVQRATQNTEEFGIEPTHGLFGSPEWWARIQSGELPIHTLRGTIARVYMGSMRDWPEFTLRTECGDESNWTRYANSKEQYPLYATGRRVELDYVLQRHRPKSFDGGAEHKVPIEIRVEECA